ncbi:hypothetical protein [Cellulophaga sp. Hel_I_12]|uniref:TapB family protein n=1 Tax=Cellulophaga sp. Hel_I_12 TaxID=1249972 RepID=UPI000646B8F9|nr:hypothetical protein [Cellulophaga sp. Hel_I_12]
MKTQTMLSLLLILAVNFASGQVHCSKYYPFEEGTSFQYSMFDKKGKPDGTSNYKVNSVINSGGETIAEMSVILLDKKGNEIVTSNYTIICTDSGVKIDFQSLMPSQMLEQYKEMDVQVDLSGTDIELPNDLSVGQELQEANVTMNVKMAGMNMKTMVNMMNRKVEKIETITTPAGSFECFVIYSENESQIMGIKKTFPSRLWLAEGVGMVKQESYQKDGDLISATELTKFK